MNTVPKRRLGRGLAALIGDDDIIPQPAQVQQAAGHSLKQVPIEMLRPNRANPRKTFSDEQIETLAASLKTKGVLQPLIVRPAEQGHYEIVAGERRWRAAQRAQLRDVPVVVRDLDDRETLEIALIENIQRTDLNPLEEALGYKQLIDSYGYTQQQIADGLGKSRSHVANTMRLLTLPDSVRKHIEDGLLTAGHARALVAMDNPDALADQIIKLGMSVRQAEDMVRLETKSARPSAPSLTKDNDTKALGAQLSDALGLGVDIKHGAKGGTLTISYKTLDQLDEVMRRLTRN